MPASTVLSRPQLRAHNRPTSVMSAVYLVPFGSFPCPAVFFVLLSGVVRFTCASSQSSSSSGIGWAGESSITSYGLRVAGWMLPIEHTYWFLTRRLNQPPVVFSEMFLRRRRDFGVCRKYQWP